VRDLSQLLHPALLDDLGLAAAIEWQARTFEARHGIRAEVQQEGLVKRLPREVELAAYRIVQEALTNVAKHSRASSCRIELRRSDANLEVIVQWTWRTRAAAWALSACTNGRPCWPAASPSKAETERALGSTSGSR
jgi:signal transduction histidine kinase